MIKLTQKDTPQLKIMFIECYCGKKLTFAGDICPIVCPHCSELLPDAYAIHKEDKQRIVYHFDEETWA